MVKNIALSFLLLILLAALPATSLSQESQTVLNSAVKAMGAGNIKTLRYSGSGSTYTVGDPQTPWPHNIMKSYVRDLNFDAGTSRVEVVIIPNGTKTEQPQTQLIDPGSPWNAQYDYWLSPYAFLKGALAKEATIESKTVLGTPYKIATFVAHDNRQVVGYITDKNLVEKVETKITHPILGDTLVETYYHNYMDFEGFQFPTTIVQKHGGTLSMILIVKEVKRG